MQRVSPEVALFRDDTAHFVRISLNSAVHCWSNLQLVRGGWSYNVTLVKKDCARRVQRVNTGDSTLKFQRCLVDLVEKNEANGTTLYKHAHNAFRAFWSL